MAVAILVFSAGCSRTALDDGDYPIVPDGGLDSSTGAHPDASFDAPAAPDAKPDSPDAADAAALPCLANAAQISAAAHYTCARKTDGTLWCWGYGILGDGSSPTPLAFVQVASLGTAVAAVSAGLDHACALRSDGTLWCWGENVYGQLGDGTTIRKTSPTEVAALGSHLAQASVGQEDTCARESDGTLWCWGDLPGGSTWKSPTPLQITPLATITEETTGSNHTCVLTTDGTVECWGSNAFGELGDGTVHPSATPVQAMQGAVHVSAGNGTTCAIRADGTLWCWGVAKGVTASNATYLPSQVTALGSDVAQVSVGGSHACARQTDGALWCWGDNEYGELGDGTTTSSSTPVRVTALGTSVAEVSSGQFHTCARTVDGAVWCWGWNWFGQLGDGTTNEHHLPVRVGGTCP